MVLESKSKTFSFALAPLEETTLTLFEGTGILRKFEIAITLSKISRFSAVLTILSDGKMLTAITYLCPNENFPTEQENKDWKWSTLDFDKPFRKNFGLRVRNLTEKDSLSISLKVHWLE
jgi:hypothetical protein